MARDVELRIESLAAIVLDASRPPTLRPKLRRSRALAIDGLGAIVLGARPVSAGRQLALSLGATFALHGGFGLGALWWAPTEAVQTSAPRSPPLRIDHVVDLTPPEPPPADEPPPPEPPRMPIAEPALRQASAPAEPPREAVPSPPAEAGQVLAADEEATQPIDFTGFDISTGGGKRYAGGVTASSGTNARAVHASHIDRADSLAMANRAQRHSLARPVGLPAREWPCPWPREADALSGKAQTVVIRVVVRPDGSVASADLVSDPGFGFGRAALACARTQAFEPARDREGQPVTATSPPVRIGFTRD